MTATVRGWARVAVAALVLVGFGWSCAQSRAADAEINELKDKAEAAEENYALALRAVAYANERQAEADNAATERIAAANDRAETAEAAAQDAQDRARNITRQLENTLPAADSARVVLARQFYETAIDSLEVVIDQRDSVIVARELQILARDERLFAFEHALTTASSTLINAQQAVIDAQDRARGWKVPLFGFRIQMKCGPSITAGITVTGRADIVGGVGCTVG